MATIISVTLTNLYNPPGWLDAEVVDWSSSQIEIEHSYGSAAFQGYGFAWNPANETWSGTATYYAEYDLQGYTTIELKDFSLPAWLFQYEWQVVFDEMLAGPDTIVLGGASDDIVFARGGDDLIYSHRGSKYIDGGSGIDTVIYESRSDDYSVTRSADSLFVQGFGSNDRLVSVERIDFSDRILAFDDNTAQMYRLYQAAFDRTPDTAGLSYWVAEADAGVSLLQAANNFRGSAEFRDLYGPNPTNDEFIDLLYLNVLNRGADQGGYDYWNGRMAAGLSEGEVLVEFSQSQENVTNTQAALWDGVWLV